MEDKMWRRYKSVLFGAIPSPLQSVKIPFVRRDYKRRLYGQEPSRHSRDEIYAMCANDIESLSTLLDDNEFFRRQGVVDRRSSLRISGERLLRANGDAA
jgi:hypothetical protein